MDILDSQPMNGIAFNYRGAPVDPELRPLWRIALIVIILFKVCSGNKANSKKIQALYALVSSDRKRNIYIGNHHGYEMLNIRFDPLVDKAIDLGVGHGLFEIDNAKSVALTKRGISFAKRIELDVDVFIYEKDFMNKFKKSHFNDECINKMIVGGVS